MTHFLAYPDKGSISTACEPRCSPYNTAYERGDLRDCSKSSLAMIFSEPEKRENNYVEFKQDHVLLKAEVVTSQQTVGRKYSVISYIKW